jgi:hypothetical protein
VLRRYTSVPSKERRETAKLLPKSAKVSPRHPRTPARLTVKAVSLAGTVALSNYSGSLVRLPASVDTDPALVLTNGHCSSLFAPGVVVTNRAVDRAVNLLDASGAQVAALRATKLVYATMTDTDVAIYELTTTYAAIKRPLRGGPAGQHHRSPGHQLRPADLPDPGLLHGRQPAGPQCRRVHPAEAVALHRISRLRPSAWLPFASTWNRTGSALGRRLPGIELSQGSDRPAGAMARLRTGMGRRSPQYP